MELPPRHIQKILEKLELLKKMMIAQLEFDKQHLTRHECGVRIKTKIHRDNIDYLNAHITLVEINPDLVSKESWSEINKLYLTYLRYGKETGSMKEVKHHVIRREGELPDIQFDPDIFGV